LSSRQRDVTEVPSLVLLALQDVEAKHLVSFSHTPKKFSDLVFVNFLPARFKSCAHSFAALHQSKLIAVKGLGFKKLRALVKVE
jgi:hypothetical protein